MFRVGCAAESIAKTVVTVESRDGDGATPTDAVAGVVLATGEVVPADVVVLAMGPWAGHAAAFAPSLAPARLSGTRAHSIVLRHNSVRVASSEVAEEYAVAPAGVPVLNQCLFLNLKDIDDKNRDPEIYPRTNGEVRPPVGGNRPARVSQRRTAAVLASDLTSNGAAVVL